MGDQRGSQSIHSTLGCHEGMLCGCTWTCVSRERVVSLSAALAFAEHLQCTLPTWADTKQLQISTVIITLITTARSTWTAHSPCTWPRGPKERNPTPLLPPALLPPPLLTAATTCATTSTQPGTNPSTARIRMHPTHASAFCERAAPRGSARPGRCDDCPRRSPGRGGVGGEGEGLGGGGVRGGG